jgi:AraC-like DNA-binding protein
MLPLPQATPLDYRIHAALDHLSRHDLSGAPHLNYLALSVNMSPSGFRQLFKAQTGVPFSRYIKILRLFRARRLLQETHLTVKQAMIAVGLFDHSHFAKDYKKEFGESPSTTRMERTTLNLEVAPIAPQDSHSGHTKRLAANSLHT